MKCCKTCRHWLSDDEWPIIPHKGFRFCRGIKIHEGEMFDVKYNYKLPSEDIDIVINTSEGLQNFQTHESFYCNKWEIKT